MDSTIVLSSAADATILHQVSHEEDENDTAATTANNTNLNQHSTIHQQHPSTTSLNRQVVNTNSMSNEEQIGLSLSPSPPSTSPSSNNEVINQIANQVSNDILSTAVNSTAEQLQTADIIQTANNSNQIDAEGVDINASLLPKPRQQQQVDDTQNTGTSTQNSITTQTVEEVNSTYDQQSTIQRIQTLESNINTLTELCQSLLLQQQQQYQQGRIRHSREGSEVSILF